MGVTFNEELHKYTDNDSGRELISVTRLLGKHDLAPDYSIVKKEVLEAKATRGTLVHKEIEEWIKEKKLGFTTELYEFIEYVNENICTPLASEVMVYNDVCAGTFDLLLQYKDGRMALVDFKTTATLHEETVMWQLNTYKKMSGKQIDMLQAFHFKADGKLKVVDIPMLPGEEVDRLFEAERKGEKFIPASETYALELAQSTLVAQLAEVETMIASIEAQKKEADKKAENIRAQLMKAMETNNIKSFESDRLKITYIKPSQKVTIDSKRLKDENPELAKQYEKTSKTGASLRITIKESKGENSND